LGCNHAGKMIWRNERERWGIDLNSGRDGGRDANDPVDRLHDYFVVVGGTLAMMNNACKTSHHSWCRPAKGSVWAGAGNTLRATRPMAGMVRKSLETRPPAGVRHGSGAAPKRTGRLDQRRYGEGRAQSST